MSERSRSMSAPPEHVEDEVTLSSAASERLHEGLLTLPMPLAREDFNVRLTEAIRAGHDFRPFRAQISTRLRWIFLPALLGFALTWSLAQAGVGFTMRMAPWIPASVTMSSVPPAPPLPPLNLQLIPAPRRATASERPHASQRDTRWGDGVLRDRTKSTVEPNFAPGSSVSRPTSMSSAAANTPIQTGTMKGARR